RRRVARWSGRFLGLLRLRDCLVRRLRYRLLALLGLRLRQVEQFADLNFHGDIVGAFCEPQVDDLADCQLAGLDDGALANLDLDRRGLLVLAHRRRLQGEARAVGRQRLDGATEVRLGLFALLALGLWVARLLLAGLGLLAAGFREQLRFDTLF